MTDAWLEQLVALANAIPAIDLVAAMSDDGSASRRPADVPYANPAERLDGFARR